jgi:hypothetical protein
MVFTTARGGTERGSVLVVTTTTRVWKRQREIPIFEKAEIYEGERLIFQKRGERFLRKRERRENRGIKTRKNVLHKATIVGKDTDYCSFL